MLRSNSKSLMNHVVSPEEKKKGCRGKDLQWRSNGLSRLCNAQGPEGATVDSVFFAFRHRM